MNNRGGRSGRGDRHGFKLIFCSVFLRPLILAAPAPPAAAGYSFLRALAVFAVYFTGSRSRLP
jgi:hypothetical protein